jgi:hypothetical protein
MQHTQHNNPEGTALCVDKLVAMECCIRKLLTKETKMNQYACFYKSKQINVEANTTYEAQQKAASQFKAKKSYEVTVMLVAKADGAAVVHTAVD